MTTRRRIYTTRLQRERLWGYVISVIIGLAAAWLLVDQLSK